MRAPDWRGDRIEELMPRLRGATGQRPELRVYLLLEDLQRQFAAYLGSPTRARGYPPFEGQHSLIVEVSPGLAIERVIDLDAPPVDAPDAYLRLHLLSHRLIAPHGLDLTGAFGVLANVVWTTAGPCAASARARSSPRRDTTERASVA